MAYRYSKALGFCPGQDVVRTERLIERAGLAPTVNALNAGEFHAEELLQHMFQDKKVESGALTLILAEGIGCSRIACADRSSGFTKGPSNLRRFPVVIGLDIAPPRRAFFLNGFKVLECSSHSGSKYSRK